MATFLSLMADMAVKSALEASMKNAIDGGSSAAPTRISGEQVIAAAPFLGGVALMAQTVGGEYDGAFADPEGRAREGALHMIVDTQTFLG